jgi:chorismate mutase-like protein
MNDKIDGAGLEALRAQLDEIDRNLLHVVRDRIQLCIRIGEYKRQHAIAMMQPHRVNAVHERAEAFAMQNGMNTGFLRQLYDVIIAETCRLEDEVIGSGERVSTAGGHHKAE